MMNETLTGGFTLPGESGHEGLTLRLAKKWGADVIRDNDGARARKYWQVRDRTAGTLLPDGSRSYADGLYLTDGRAQVPACDKAAGLPVITAHRFGKGCGV